MVNGEIDIFELTKLNEEDVRPYTDAGMQLIVYDNSVIWWNAFNLTKPVFDDVRVRQAINYAMDTDAIVQYVLEGIAKVPVGPFPVGSRYTTSGDVNAYPYDADKAKQLLAEAGYEDADGDGIVEKNGEPLTLSYVYSSDNEIRAQYALITQQQLKAVGINVVMVDMDFNSLVSEMRTRDSDRYDMGLMGASLRVDVSRGFTTVNQFTFLTDHEQYQSYMAELNSTLDQSKRYATAVAFGNWVYEQSPAVFLYGLPRGFAAHPDLRIVSYMYEYTSHAHEWYFE
jgi:peptide/nickel transport system substrate-binding protein